jgi:hypothetical protein
VRTWRLVSGGTAAGNLNDYAQSFLGVITPAGSADKTTSYLACLSSSYTLTQVRTQIISPVRGAYAFVDLGTPAPGARGVAGSANSDGSIEASTALAGRSQVASYKIGPISTTDQTAGLISAGLSAALSNYAATFTQTINITVGNISGWFPCIYHRAPKAGMPVSDDIIEASNFTEVRVKNTRTLRRGE